jgi:8-oxo-dGTP pyrophosphatase MutT (NUDIX family)
MSEPRHETKLAQWHKEGREGSAPVAAATVLLLRDGREGLETLMLRRNSKIAFGGMWVFPGGRVDEADCEGEADDDLAHARRAAVREAEEETGLLIEPDAMLPFSHWTPPPITPRRFLTWFFAAAAPQGEVRIDEGEIHEHQWMSPHEALARRDAAEIELAPPTWVSLFELTRWQDVGTALGALQQRQPERFETRIVVEGSGPIALWHGDAGYPTGELHAEGPRHRLLMNEGIWRYERSHWPDAPTD